MLSQTDSQTWSPGAFRTYFTECFPRSYDGITDLCSRAYITDSVLHKLESDSIIDHITPDSS